MLRRVGLTDVLQMECLARNSSVLEVNAPDAHGEIYLRSGSIIHAWAGELKGEDAFNLLLALKGGQFALRPFVAPSEQTIDALCHLARSFIGEGNSEDLARADSFAAPLPSLAATVRHVRLDLLQQ